MKILEQGYNQKLGSYTYKIKLNIRERELLKKTDTLTFFLELLELSCKFYKNDFGFQEIILTKVDYEVELSFKELNQLDYYIPNRMFAVDFFDHENGGRTLGVLVSSDNNYKIDYIQDIFNIVEIPQAKLSYIQQIGLFQMENKGYKLSNIQNSIKQSTKKIVYEYELNKELTNQYNKNIYECRINLISCDSTNKHEDIVLIDTLMFEEGFMFNTPFKVIENLEISE